MKRRLFWLLWNVWDKLDDGLHWFRRRIDRLEPPFVPTPLPEPHYDNIGAACSRCNIHIAVPVLSTAPAGVRWAVLETALEAHRCEAHHD